MGSHILFSVSVSSGRIIGQFLAATITLHAAPAHGVTRQSAPDSTWRREPLRAASYTAVSRRSLYLTARDGVRLATDVYLPMGLPAGTTLPTILEQRRYWRGSDATVGVPNHTEPLIETMVTRGYAYVVTDVRGSGASFGTRGAELSKSEVDDNRDMVDWIVRQPWSNGRIGTTGESYAGLTAYLSKEPGHPGIRAVAPRFAPHDAFADLIAPGGLVLSSLLTALSIANRRGSGPPPRKSDQFANCRCSATSSSEVSIVSPTPWRSRRLDGR